MSPRERYELGIRTGVKAVRDVFLQALVVVLVIAIAAHFFD